MQLLGVVRFLYKLTPSFLLKAVPRLEQRLLLVLPLLEETLGFVRQVRKSGGTQRTTHHFHSITSGGTRQYAQSVIGHRGMFVLEYVHTLRSSSHIAQTRKCQRNILEL